MNLDEINYCPDCSTILIEKPEKRADGIVEIVEYCYKCGNTAT